MTYLFSKHKQWDFFNNTGRLCNARIWIYQVAEYQKHLIQGKSSIAIQYMLTSVYY